MANVPPDSIQDHPFYRGVVVAITNEGTRSGKEGLACLPGAPSKGLLLR